MIDKIKVGGITYSIVEQDFVEINGNRNYLGSCDYDNATINVLKELCDEKKEQVIVHELTHAIFHEAGYDEHDEDMVNRIGLMLHQVLKDNF